MWAVTRRPEAARPRWPSGHQRGTLPGVACLIADPGGPVRSRFAAAWSPHPTARFPTRQALCPCGELRCHEPWSVSQGPEWSLRRGLRGEKSRSTCAASAARRPPRSHCRGGRPPGEGETGTRRSSGQNLGTQGGTAAGRRRLPSRPKGPIDLQRPPSGGGQAGTGERCACDYPPSGSAARGPRTQSLPLVPRRGRPRDKCDVEASLSWMATRDPRPQ